MSATLLLNADGMPVSWIPLSTLTWEEAIKYMVLDKADVLVFHDNWVVHSERWTTQVPSVMMLRDYMKPKTAVRFSRTNIYIRDNHKCQYCADPIDTRHATIDHVQPVSKGGKSTWENCVTACAPCNSSKSDVTKGWHPKVKPYKPDYYELISKRRSIGFDVRFDEWKQFIT